MKTYTQAISLSGRRKKKLEKQVEKGLNTLKGNRNDPRVHIELGDTYAQLEDLRNSIKHYYAAIALLRQTPGPGKVKNLIPELYEKVITIAPNEPKTYLDLSEEYVAAGQKEKAFRFLLTSAKKAYESENYELALQCYNQVIAKGRTNPHIVERCTELYLKLGKKDEAMRNYVQIGDTYAQEEKNIEALEYYKKACAVDKDNPELILKIARMYNAMAWTENAASELVRVGEFYEKQREYTEALRYYRYSVRLDPENEKAQEGRKRIVETHPGDDLALNDMEDGEERGAADVLDELEKIEDAGAANMTANIDGSQASPEELEMTPFDLNATLTFEGGADSVGDAGQPTQPEPEALFNDVDQEMLFNLLDEKNAFAVTDREKLLNLTEREPESPETNQAMFFNLEDDMTTGPLMDIGQQTEPEPEILPLDLELTFPAEELESLPEASPLDQKADSADTLSLEDWIIDLKEDELVELALEEALRSQETPATEAGVSPFLSIPGDTPDNADQENSELPALPGQVDDDWMNVGYESAAVPIEAEVTQHLDSYLEENHGDHDKPGPAEPFLQIDLEPYVSAELRPQAPPTSSPVEAGAAQRLEVDLAKEHGTAQETLFKAERDRETEWFNEFPAERAEVAEQPEQTQIETEQPERAPSFFEETIAFEAPPEQAQPEVEAETEAEFAADAAAPEEELTPTQSTEEHAVEFPEATTPFEEPEPVQVETEPDFGFATDAAAREEELPPTPAAEEYTFEFLEDESRSTEPEQAPSEIAQSAEAEEHNELFAEMASFKAQPEQVQPEAEAESDFELSEDIAAFEEDLSQLQAVKTPTVTFAQETSRSTGPDQTPPAEKDLANFFADTVNFEEEEADVSFHLAPATEQAQFDQAQVRDNLIGLREKIEDLEQRLQRTEEEKYFLQERFAAQISHHKANEESLQREIADIYKNKEALEKQLQESPRLQAAPLEVTIQQISAALLPGRKGSEKFDEARYEALIGKIQSKKTLLQQHLNKLLKKRQENGRFLTEELNNLNATKQRLQSNVAYMQQIKNRLEEKINTELLQAKQEAQALSQRSQELEDKLRGQQQVEQNLRKQFKNLTKEKELLQETYTKSLNALTKEKTGLEKQVEQASQAKKAVERILRNKLQNLHQAYQQVKGEYKTALTAKETQIKESAQQLSEFADKYVNLEKTLADIRKERDKLNTLLLQESSTRETLEEKLVNIESQVDSLEVQGTKLLTQLGQELDRHFDSEQIVSDKFQLSLDELEGLLVLQEKEIRSLEAL